MALLIVAGRRPGGTRTVFSLPVRSSNCHSTSDFGGQDAKRLASIRRTENSSTGNRPMIVNRGNYVCMSGQEQNTGTGRGEYYFNVARVGWKGVGDGWGRGGERAARRATWPAILVLASLEFGRLGKRQRGNSLAKIFTHDGTLPTSSSPLYPFSNAKSILSREIISKNYTNIYIHIYIKRVKRNDIYFVYTFQRLNLSS